MTLVSWDSNHYDYLWLTDTHGQTSILKQVTLLEKELPHAHRLVQNTDDVYNYRRPPTDNSNPKHNQSTSPHCGGCELVSLDTRYEACEAIRPKCHHGNCGLMHYQTVIVLSSK